MIPGLTFGIYPLSAAGTPTGLAVGPEDNFEKIQNAIKDLGGSKKLHPRIYLIYTKEWESKMLSLAEQYHSTGLLADLTLGYGDWTAQQDSYTEMDNWLEFIHKVISRFGKYLTSLQITNEPNLSFMEGSNPNILQFLVKGLIAAKNETKRLNLPVKIGFGSVPDGPMAISHFWEGLAEAGSEFHDSVDFVAHNFYVDVFEEEPLKLDEILASTEQILRNLRANNLVKAGIPNSVPIRITENGWPTGKNPFNGIMRSYEHQADVLATVVNKIYNLRNELLISHYVFFGLRDADSSKEELFYQFGIMQDDYSPKPAFVIFKKLIESFGI